MVDFGKRDAGDPVEDDSAGAGAAASEAGQPTANVNPPAESKPSANGKAKGVSMDKGVSLDKTPATEAPNSTPKPGGKGNAGAPADAARPRSIVATIYAIGVQLVFAAVAAVLAWPLSDELRREIIKANDKATGTNHKVLCSAQQVKGCLNVDSTLHSLQVRTLIGTIFVTAILIYAAVRLYRGVRTGRTIYIAVSVVGGLFVGFGGSPLAIASAFAGGPAAPRIVQTIAGLASVFAVVLLFRPDSSQFFATWSPRPTGQAAGGRPGGLGGLFRPPPPRERKPAPTSGLRSTAASRAEARVAKVAKAKSRNDAEAIARGAELARTRAKAAKSRRSER